MTHSELCIAACRWLIRQGAKHAFAEFSSMAIAEFPDAIGFPASTGKGPTVIEVKVSRVDFLRDKSKGWRHRAELGHDECGMGERRYYLVPDGLVLPEEIPDDHGLLCALPRGRIRLVKEAPVRARRDIGSEVSILCVALSRYKRGIHWIDNEFRFETIDESDRRRDQDQKAVAV